MRREDGLSGRSALESPEKIRGIEEMDEELSVHFEYGEIQREDEEREEEKDEEKDEEKEEERDEEEEDAKEQREEYEKSVHGPLKSSLSSQQGFTCSCCLSRNHDTAYPFCVCCGYKVL